MPQFAVYKVPVTLMKVHCATAPDLARLTVLEKNVAVACAMQLK